MDEQNQPQPSEAVQLLRDLVAHLAYDAGVNGSKFTDHPYGRISLSVDGPNTIFSRMLAASGVAAPEEAEDLAYVPFFRAMSQIIAQQNQNIRNGEQQERPFNSTGKEQS